MVTSIFLSTLPVVGILMGMQCTRILETSPDVKRKIMIGSGICYFLTSERLEYIMMTYLLVYMSSVSGFKSSRAFCISLYNFGMS